MHDINVPREHPDEDEHIGLHAEHGRSPSCPGPERDPLGKDPHELGAKLDAGKDPVLRGCIQYFPRALKYVAGISDWGARQYAWEGWRTVPDGINRYGNAQGRHLCDEKIDGPLDPKTGKLHAGQAAWNALARLELILEAQEKGQ